MASNVKDEKGKPGFFSKMGRSLRDMRGELKRVVWPSRKQVINNTLIVIGFMLVAAVFVGLFDYALALLRGLFFAAGA